MSSVSVDALPEILAPAGSPDAVIAAVRCGADAVYLGGSRFNARGRARNFDDAALGEAVSYCHARGVRVYLTLNTLVRERELTDALDLAAQAAAYGVDACIVQDVGLARLLRQRWPGWRLHASTQLSCHTPAGVRELAAMGFARVVLARELTRDEIAACCGQGCEIEVFVHGALCMSVSGQCLLSAMLGGRSGNRGLCAQPCRLPFAVEREGGPARAHGTAALSLRDGSLIPHVGELAALGVASFKIEGRMKRPEYVAAATAAVRQARDGVTPAGYGCAEALQEDLQRVFSRSGFTDGYYTGCRGASLFGTRREEDAAALEKAAGRLRRLYARELPRVPVTLRLTAQAGEPLMVEARDDRGHTVRAVGDVPAPGPGLSIERLREQLAKTGGTPFAAQVTCIVQPHLALTCAQVNALRRTALDGLLAQRGRARPIAASQPPAAADDGRRQGLAWLYRRERPLLVARFARAEQVPSDLAADVLVLPWDTPEEIWRCWCGRLPVMAETPRGLFDSVGRERTWLERACACGVRAGVANNIGALPLLREAGLSLVAGWGLPLTNAAAAAALYDQGVSAVMLSPELTWAQQRFGLTLGLPAGAIVYGRLPLMLMRQCPVGAQRGCGPCRRSGEAATLVDRQGVRFPVQCTGGCAELLNSVPLYWADKPDAWAALDFAWLHFTTETPAEAAGVLEQYRRGGTPPAAFTRGLYLRGVE